MSDEELSESLAAAVADHASYRLARVSANACRAPILVSFTSLKVISAIGEARRAGVVADHSRSARIAALAVARDRRRSRSSSSRSQPSRSWSAGRSSRPEPSRGPSSVNVHAVWRFGRPAHGGQHARSPCPGPRTVVPRHCIGICRRPCSMSCPALPGPRFASAVAPVYCETFLALALWQFVWLFPSEPKPRWARTIGKGFLVAASAVGLLLFASNVLLGFMPGSSPAPSATRSGPWIEWRRRASYWPLLFTVAAPAIPYLVWKSRVETATNRRKVTWFVASIGIALSPMLLAVLLTPLVPALGSPSWRGRVGAVLVHRAGVDRADDGLCRGRQPRHGSAPRHPQTIQYGLAKTSVWCAILLPLLYLLFDVYRHRDLRVAEYLTVRQPLEPLLLSLVSFARPDISTPDPPSRRSLVPPRRRRSHRIAGKARTRPQVRAHDSRHLRCAEAGDRACRPSHLRRRADGRRAARATGLPRERGAAAPPGLRACSTSCGGSGPRSNSAIALTAPSPDCCLPGIARGSRAPASGCFRRSSARPERCSASSVSAKTSTACRIPNGIAC